MKTISSILKHLSFLLGVLCLSIVLFSNCSDDDNDDDNDGGETATLSISPAAADIIFTGEATESFTFTVTTNQPSWSVKTSPSSVTWCTAEKTTDGKGFTVKAEANTANEPREQVTITLTAGEAKAISFSATQGRQAFSIYLAGYEKTGDDSFYATYWVNGQKTRLGESLHLEDTYSPLLFTVSGQDVYVAKKTHIGDLDVACYWKNGELVTLGTGLTESHATGITISDNDVFVSGYESNTKNQSIACYWKNGTRIELTDGTNNVFAKDIAVSGSDIYVLGYEWVESENMPSIPFYWKNGTRIPLTNSMAYDSANTLTVAGNDVYVAGKHYDDGLIYACYWKNGEKVILGVGASESDASFVYVSGEDIYVTGSDNNLACYWKNGEKIILGDSAYSYAQSIFIYDNDVYVAGSENSTATYWVNGEKVTLENGGFSFSSIIVK